MHYSKLLRSVFAGAAAGAVNGLFGTGGGMVLIPLLPRTLDLPQTDVFPACVSIMLPICLVSILLGTARDTLNWSQALPYLIGSCIGGLCCMAVQQKITAVWLHRCLGGLLLLGSIKSLC